MTEETKATPIQCLLRRKGGTKVTFGHNAAKQKTYHFKPLNDDPESPHVCQVDDDEHADRFLAITEAYRLYRGDGLVDAIPVTAGVIDDSFKNRFDDILSIDFDNVPNDVVADWAGEVLEVTPAHHAKIKAKAKSLNVTVKTGDTMTEVLRNIGKAMQEQERLASHQVTNDQTAEEADPEEVASTQSE